MEISDEEKEQILDNFLIFTRARRLAGKKKVAQEIHHLLDIPLVVAQLAVLFPIEENVDIQMPEDSELFRDDILHAGSVILSDLSGIPNIPIGPITPLLPSHVRPIDSSCLGRCVSNHLGLTVTGTAGVGVGQPIIPTRTKPGGSTRGTSPASKVLAKTFPQRLPRRVPAPTLATPGAKTAVLGRALGRWVPIAGWALLGVDGALILKCYGECTSNDTSYVYCSTEGKT